MLKVNTKAPNFKLENQHHQWTQLSDFIGKKIVLYFYPKDHTPGCTQQACAFRDSFASFNSKDIIVIGISKDTTKSHQKFVEDYKLPFLLLADPNREAIEAYEVWIEKNMYGKKTMGVSRTTYIIDEQGKIQYVFEKAHPDTNAAEILKYLDIH